MVKPVPIFEFAFAAYAATAWSGDARAPAEPERRPFEITWRSMANRDGALLVKIGVLDNSRASATALTPLKSRLPIKEIWLGQIKETANGYSGVVCMTQTPLRHIGVGERIDFGPTHILDWTISFEALPECAALRKQPNSAAACLPCGDCNLAEEALA
jgi:hypothetical protein